MRWSLKRTFGAGGERRVSPLAVGDVVLVGLGAREEVFEGGSAGTVLAVNGRLGLRRYGSSRAASAKEGVGKVMASNTSSSLRKTMTSGK